MSVSKTGWTLVITGFTWMLVSMIAGFSLIGLEQIYGGIPVYCKSAHSHLATCSIILVAMGVAIALAGRYDIEHCGATAKWAAFLSSLGTMFAFLMEYLAGLQSTGYIEGASLTPMLAEKLHPLLVGVAFGMGLFFIGIILAVKVCFAAISEK